MDLNDALLIHGLVLSYLLVFEYFELRRHSLFHWLSAGFWVWGAVLFYCLLAPLGQYYLGDSSYVETRLAVTEGIPRLLWITCCIAIGTYVFFFIYIRSRPAQIRLSLPQNRWPIGTSAILALALAGAAYSLITYRGFVGIEVTQKLEIVQGKFSGGVIGYQYVLHMLALFPIALLIFRKTTRYLGYALAVFYIVGRFDDAWDRMSIVSMLLCIAMITTMLRRRRWPSPLFLGVILLITVVLEARGHISMKEYISSGHFTSNQVTQEVKQSPSAAMLQTLWLESYLSDQSGYTYGMPLLNDLIFGALPRKYFPWKSDLLDELIPYKTKDTEYIYGSELMYGAKSMVFGSLYDFGGLIGIIVGMAFFGFLARKLDGLNSPHSPLLLRMLGIVWLSQTWMIFGSSLTWGAQTLFLSGLPCAGMVIINKIFPIQEKTEDFLPEFPLAGT
jgi:hypothetical protein